MVVPPNPHLPALLLVAFAPSAPINLDADPITDEDPSELDGADAA